MKNVRLLRLCIVTATLYFTLVPNLLSQQQQFADVPYDIVYVRAPRFGDQIRTRMPEVKDPIQAEPGSDLVLLRADGSEELLVAGGNGAVMDPVVSFDALWVYYALIPDLLNINTQRRDAARSGSDIFKINLATREIVQLTFQEWTPNTGARDWSDDPLQENETGANALRYGIYNLGPCPLPGDRVMFTSSRNGFAPNKSFTFPNLQLYVMDEDGANVECVGHLNLGSALHPTVLTDGRVMFSSYEAQGLRDQRIWGLWAIWPDGRNWEPLMSALHAPSAFHWQAQLSDGSIVIEEYYNQNNNGFGTFLKFPASIPNGTIPFGGPDPNDVGNPSIPTGWFFNGKIQYTSYAFSPWGLEGVTQFTHGRDNAAPFLDGTGDERTGKVAQPSGAPNNDLLLVWSPGPANDLNRPVNKPVYDAGLYVLENGAPINDHRDLLLIKNDPDFNEQQPRAVVTYRDIYDIDEPAELPWLPNDGSLHAELPAGTPYGLVGTSSFYRRDSKPGKGVSDFDGLDPFNTSQNGASTNWGSQGADAGRYSDSDIYAVRVVALEPTSAQSYGPNNGQNFSNHANERMRILGEVPLRKVDAADNPVLDPDGNPDTSFLAKIPADVPFTFQTIDRNAMTLNSAQTWHQVRPGEIRNNCGGCHAHSQEPLDFSATAAARFDYQIPDLANETPMISRNEHADLIQMVVNSGAVDVEYYRDIKPILSRSCVQCHSADGVQEAGLVLDDEELVNGFENTYNRLANDSQGQYGVPPLVGSWRQNNRSRYLRAFQSRRSLLVWKIFGERLDGWSNVDHPTAAIPGDASSLPGGGSQSEINLSDLDFSGTICPTPDSGVPPLTEDEKMTVARWIDLGAPITKQQPGLGWFTDEIRPTLTVSSPRAGRNDGPLTLIRIGAHDFYTGLDDASFSVTADFEVDGNPPGTDLASSFRETGDHIWTLSLQNPILTLSRGELVVSISDNQGNVNELIRRFSVGETSGTTPTLEITTLAYTPGDSGIDVEFLYVARGNLSAVSHPVFQLDDTPAQADSDFDGHFIFFGVAVGDHVLRGHLADSENAPIAGTDFELPVTVLPPINQPPAITAFMANTVDTDPDVAGIQVFPDTAVDLTATATDPEDDAIAWQWILRIGNGGEQQLSGGNGTVTQAAYVAASADVNETHTFTLRVTDGATQVEQSVAIHVVEPPDTAPPSIPTGVAGEATSENQIVLTWTASSDNVGVAGYRLFSNGLQIADLNTLSFIHDDLLEATAYTYEVLAYDAAGNASQLSAATTVETPAPLPKTVIVAITARDQDGVPVPDAEFYLQETRTWYRSGTELELDTGATVRLRAKRFAFKGDTFTALVSADGAEIVAPFRRASVTARDLSGAVVENAQIDAHKVPDSPLGSESELTLPVGAVTLFRGRLGPITGPWRTVRFEHDLDTITVPFRKLPVTARDQAGTDITESVLHVHRYSTSPLEHGSGVTLPLGAAALVRGQIGEIRGPWLRFTVGETLDEFHVPFRTRTIVAADQNGHAISDTDIFIHRYTVSPVSPGAAVTLPEGASTLFRGKIDKVNGPWLRVTFDESSDTVEVPYQTATIEATDQFGNDVPEALIYVHRLTGNPVSSGAQVTLPRGAHTLVRGRVDTIHGPWTRVWFTPDTSSVVVPFRSVRVTAADQFGMDIGTAQIHVHRLANSPIAPGARITFPEGASTLFRGQVDGVRGPWTRYSIDADREEIMVPFWTATIEAVDGSGAPLPQALVHGHRLDNNPFTHGATVTLASGASTLFRIQHDGRRSRWQRFLFGEGLTAVQPQL